MHTHVVAARSAVTLHGGRPAAPGDHVTPDAEHDRALLAAGALLALEDAIADPPPRRRHRSRSVRAPASTTTSTMSQEDA